MSSLEQSDAPPLPYRNTLLFLCVLQIRQMKYPTPQEKQPPDFDLGVIVIMDDISITV